jgi:hypothetical protein
MTTSMISPIGTTIASDMEKLLRLKWKSLQRATNAIVRGNITTRLAPSARKRLRYPSMPLPWCVARSCTGHAPCRRSGRAAWSRMRRIADHAA